ncbi:MAG: insulinase family protein [Clostridia bacterium]|nr:insulinase family protein [Clostridia bacterium]
MSEEILVKSSLLREEYRKLTHKSGLRIYVFPKKLSTAYAALTVRFGSLDNTLCPEGEGELLVLPDGIAHFLEHKMFENEDHVDTFDRFSAIGASANAYTSTDVTSYLFSASQNFSEALKILIDSVFHPYFTEKNVTKEQGIIAQEIKMYDDSPANRLYYALMELLYESHGIRTNICGSCASIAEITPELLMQCYRTFYRPDNMVLIVCGDVPCEDVVAVVDATLTEPARASLPPRRETREGRAPLGRHTEFRMDIARPKLSVGIKDTAIPDTPEARERRALILNLAADLYFGESSPFFDRLYRDGLISRDFDVGYESARGCGHMLFSAATDDTARLENEILDEISAIAGGKTPTEEDFDRLLRVHYAEYIKSFDNTEAIATALLDAVIDGVDLFQTGEVIASITREELMRTAKEFFNRDNVASVVINPTKGRK